ncbi:MAG: hypothetical protein IKR85_04610 [Clostridia bacterium]|nr:hypothetical protein [Clostridia bacterium]
MNSNNGMKRISGSGKTPYVWKERPAGARSAYSRTPSRAQVRRGKGYRIRIAPALPVIALVSAVVITVFTLMNLNSVKRNYREAAAYAVKLNEDIKAKRMELDYEKSDSIVSRKAAEKLSMVRTDEYAALLIDLPSDTVETAGR